MFNKIEIENFKLFNDLIKVDLEKINIFTGINGRGKSTFLQSLILMKQSLEENKINRLNLQGDYLELGTFDDVKNIGDDIIFNFYVQDVQNKYTFTSSSTDSLVLDCKDKTVETDYFEESFNKLHFISAERLGPKVYYKKLPLKNTISVGKNGEYVASILSIHGNSRINKVLIADKREADNVIYQSAAWLNKVFNGGSVKVGRSLDTVLELSYQGASNKFSKPTNVGFGYSNVLPIIVAGLTLKEGDVLIIDSPEAHLHPSAQAELSKFLVKVSLTGIQVMIETHSEHILNSVRISINSSSYDITNNDTCVYYFQDCAINKVKKIEIDSNGKIDEWPAGFFDQAEKDLTTLYGL